MLPTRPSLLLRLLDWCGLNALFRHLNRRRHLILYYHGICEDDFELLRGYDVRQLPVSLFAEQLRFLEAAGYRFASLDEVLAAMRSGRGERLVSLSFDDGLRNVVQRAYPLMRERGAKGEFYVVTDLVGTEEMIWTDRVETLVRNASRGVFAFECRERIEYLLSDEASNRRTMKDVKRRLRRLPDRERLAHLEQYADVKLWNVPREFVLADWDELRTLDPDVLGVGSHTATHPDCATLETEAELERELRDSRLRLEDELGRPARHFCYPAGSYDARVRAAVRANGYASAVSTREGLVERGDDLFTLRRLEADDEMYRFKAETSGSLEFVRALRARLSTRKGGASAGTAPDRARDASDLSGDGTAQSASRKG